MAPDRIVVATARSSFVHEPSPILGDLDPFARPMRGRGSRATTRHLLDGAIEAARPASRRPRRPALTPARWVWRLAGSYRTTEATPRLLDEAAERFAAAGEARLCAWARARSREETGHDRLALRDIEALGFDARALVESVIPPLSRALVDFFTTAVRGPEGPIGCVGYAYMLERLALGRGPEAIAAVVAALPPGVDATRCLRVHSRTGSDQAHVDETVALCASLPAARRAAIAASCFSSASVYFAPTAPITEERLIQLLLPFRQRAVFDLGARTRKET